MEEVLVQDKPYIEYLDGKAYPKAVSPKARHSIVQGAAFTILRRCSAGIGIAGTEWDFRLGIVAVEVRSPSYRPAFAAEKIVRYLRRGSVLVLDVDPVKRVVFAHSAGGVHTFVESARFTHEATPWLAFDVAEFFSDLDLLMS